MPVTKAFVLSLGEVCWERGEPGARRRAHIPVLGYLLFTDSGRRIVVDTGMNRGHVDDPKLTWRGTAEEDSLVPMMRLEDTLDYRLAAMGLRGGDITDVVNTHLHFDHAGNNDAFEKATIFVQQSQYETATGNPSFPNQYWRLPDLSYRLLEGETDLGDGITAFPTPGHTVGHQSVLVALPSGRHLLICGDAIYDEESLLADNWVDQADPPLAKASAAVLLDKARKAGAYVIYGHDPRQYKELRRAPAWYE